MNKLLKSFLVPGWGLMDDKETKNLGIAVFVVAVVTLVFGLIPISVAVWLVGLGLTAVS